MQEYEDLGHMREVTAENDNPMNYFLPHHGVYRPEKSTIKGRVVFNASSPTDNGLSLNGIQLNGGVIQDDLYAQMIRFRTFRYALTADIKKMYRMILIDSEQRCLQQILWKDSKHDRVKTYELQTGTYGMTSAPYLAQRTLRQLSYDEENKFPVAALVLRSQFYMNDTLCGAETLEEAKKLQRQLIPILKSAGMELHKICGNHSELSQCLNEIYDFSRPNKAKTLGVSWDSVKDTFSFKVDVMPKDLYTKRSVLSIIARLFDPLGLVGPVVSKIHGFSDVSERCYGAAVYCKSKNNSGVTLVRLITRESRVSPIKGLTIPRLELCTVVLLSKLVKRVIDALKLESVKVYLWTNSMILLSWLQKEPMDLKTFVQNRIPRIQDLFPWQWRHLPSNQNPADLISRGVDPDKLLNQELWWNGPEFLLSGSDYPNKTVKISENNDAYNSELKNSVREKLEKEVPVLNICVNDFVNNLCNISNNYLTILRILSYIFRFINNARRKVKTNGPLEADELDKAEVFLIKGVQSQEFSESRHYMSTTTTTSFSQEYVEKYQSIFGFRWSA
ncbi:uncharacterized protein TNCV_1565091 [Trichonephila clavipes]|nr:uncharacterized protein TNCV_1565091 [Trichonephila clavipes]